MSTNLKKNVVHCLRCQGTVEGPKFSTCTCPLPLLEISNNSTNSTHNNDKGGSFLRLFTTNSQVADVFGTKK